jgi:hypothetical protein
VVKELFDNNPSLLTSVYLPVGIERVDAWYPRSSGITRQSIVGNHTLYPYFSVSCYPYSENIKDISKDISKGGNLYDAPVANVLSKTICSRIKFLRYCPECAAEDIVQYGETYWHRQHQLAEILYCTKHGMRLENSSALLQDAYFRFSPASAAVKAGNIHFGFDALAPYKDKFLKIGRECEWLIAHGMDIDWSGNGYEKYRRLLRDKGLASFWGLSHYAAMDESFFEYWGRDFLSILFDTVGIPHFDSWYHKMGAQQVSRFTLLFHILTMCWLADSVNGFTESNPPETPFGHPPYICENKICSHYHIDGAKMIRLVDYGSGKVAYFECEYCGLIYKYAISNYSKGQRDVVDYGHLWLGELRRCCQDPKITIQQTMEILKCGPQTLASQKIKNGLMRRVRYDPKIGAMAFYKEQVLKVCQEYDEVTIALLNELAPGAYDYLQDRDYEWIRSRVVLENERSFRIERENLLLSRLQSVIAAFDAGGYPNKVLSYGYIAEMIGATHHELRQRMSPGSKLRAYLDEVVEHKATWRQERAARTGTSYAPPTHAPKPQQPSQMLSKREGILLNRVRDVIADFEIEGYPDKQLSHGYLAALVGTTPSELMSTAATGTELRELLDEVVEHRSIWREERSARLGSCCTKREYLLRDAIEQIWANPPEEQISYNYIARTAGITVDTLKDSLYLHAFVNGHTEGKEAWMKRRFVSAYRNKTIAGKSYSALMICELAGIDWKTYDKHSHMFKVWLDDLATENEIETKI